MNMDSRAPIRVIVLSLLVKDVRCTGAFSASMVIGPFQKKKSMNSERSRGFLRLN
jgi:hypothetical protein